MRLDYSHLARRWMQVAPRFLPFADVITADLPLGRLLRLSLFQVSVGMAMVLLNGTLNRVMVVEMGVATWLVALMVSLPLVFAPLRALIGFRSDHHRSALGWRRVPYIWFGSLLQFSGLAIMPFALLLLAGNHNAPAFIGQVGAAVAFLLVGAGFHTTQTAGLALATDLAPEEARPRVVALLYITLLLGMVGSALLFGALLTDFNNQQLIQVIQGAAVATMALNVIALWKQEARDPSRTRADQLRPSFRQSWQEFMHGGRASRLLIAVGLGTAGFAMQDILLEPYGGQILHLSVSATTVLTAILASGSLAAFIVAGHVLARGYDPHRLAGYGAVLGIFAFAAIVFAAPLASPLLFRIGTALIGFGGGIFAVGTLTAAMSMAKDGQSGLALGAWGAVQATAMGVAIALGGFLRDGIGHLAMSGQLGSALVNPSTGYAFVYHLEIILLFVTLIAVGPLVQRMSDPTVRSSSKLGLTELP
ncbi:BCD family MFS transporter [Rhodopseudomonas palustris]|uniref:BCD family MFS transporter n=1 Tax=Thiospirillum jenense TaxID=1653858 RepID=A0A839H881_9GAMM|nr:BCD family MFS transporter [Thiospirillum jenense]MBB1089738.1 BCD family MFS transporter [Rhodopseudomonas palustris]MBB1124840.1 BCD family MFS transporter [Thiospirillum jenense]